MHWARFGPGRMKLHAQEPGRTRGGCRVPVPPGRSSAAADHIATPDAVQARLAEATAQRAQNLATVQDVLSTPLARGSRGLRRRRPRPRPRRRGRRFPTPSSATSRRGPPSLQSDPVAGAMDRNMRLLIMAALILVVIILLLAVID